MAAEFEDWAVDRLMSLSKVKLHKHAFREIVHHMHGLDDFAAIWTAAPLFESGNTPSNEFMEEFNRKKKKVPKMPIFRLTNEGSTADLQNSMLPDLMSVSMIKLHERAFREIIGHLADLNVLDFAIYLGPLCGNGAEAIAFCRKFLSEKERLRNAGLVSIKGETEVIDLDSDEQPLAIKREYECDATRQCTDLALFTKQEAAPSVDKKSTTVKREPNAAVNNVVTITDKDGNDHTQSAATTKKARSTSKEKTTAAVANESAASKGKTATSTGKTAATEKDIVTAKGKTAASKVKTSTSKSKTAASKGKTAASKGKTAASNGRTAVTGKDIVATNSQTAESNQDRTLTDLARPKSTRISKHALQHGKTHACPSTENSPGIRKEATFIDKIPPLIRKQPNAICEEPWCPSDSDDEFQPNVSTKMLSIPSNDPPTQTKQVSTLPQFSNTETVSLLLGTDVTLEYIKQHEGDDSVNLIKFDDDGVVALDYTMAIEWTTDTREEVRRFVFFAQHPEYAIYGPSLEDARAMDKAHNRVYALMGYERHPNHPKFFELMALKQQALTGAMR